MKQKYIVWFEEVNKHDIPLVGGKGANLGEMTSAGLPIPYGFILTSHAYFYFIEHQGIKSHIDRVLKTLNHQDPANLAHVSKEIKKIIIGTAIPSELTQPIASYYEQIYEKEEKTKHLVKKLSKRLYAAYDPALVAVRSSATAEDLPGASFAGQQETYLNVKGEVNLLHKIRECWASLFTERAIFYRAEKGFDHFKVGLAAVVQRMVQSDKSGIMFTVDPVNNDKKTIIIESIFGLGEYIVQGKVTPDQYLISKYSLDIKEKKVGFQDVKYIKKGTKNIEVKLTKSLGSRQKISDKEIVEVARLGKKIENHYYFPQDIEWAIEGDKVFITQSRPITTLDNKQISNDQQIAVTQEVFLTGDPASPGITTGTVVLLKSPKEISRVKQGDILLASQTNPDYVPAMKRACAIITEHGGRTSHAAIVSRELGIPCVVGVADAMSKIKEGDVLTVNGANGQIYKGKVEIHMKAEVHKAYKTKTKMYINLAEPEKAEEMAKLPVQGVGLLRAEFMIANIGEHPKSLMQKGKGYVFTNRLKRDLTTICQAFYPRKVVYRATDFKTNEYRFLKGGKDFEPEEANPMLGYRGTYRYISDPEEFGLEIDAIRKVREEGLTNLHLMLPFVRSPMHLRQAKEFVQNRGLTFNERFKLWMMVELPVNVILIEDFLKEGIQGVSIGSNDLTMLLLGTDRDNETVAPLFDERNEAVYWALKKTIHACNNYGVTSSICGQSVSDYSEILNVVVKSGITSVSINPDAVWHVSESINQLEEHGS
ncbi:MAG: phosphoenolpyruvate synthase [Patescibacteria group bacterium]|jgi:pyruvate,water dikinase